MADDDQNSRYRRRRMAGALVVLGCLAITFGCTYFIHTNNPSTVGLGIHAPSSSSYRSRDLLHRRRRRRRRLQSSTSIKRVRSHSVSIEIAEEDDNDNRDAAISSSKSNGGIGITARDSNGLLIEIAPRSQSSSNENAESKQTDASSSSSKSGKSGTSKSSYSGSAKSGKSLTKSPTLRPTAVSFAMPTFKTGTHFRWPVSYYPYAINIPLFRLLTYSFHCTLIYH